MQSFENSLQSNDEYTLMGNNIYEALTGGGVLCGVGLTRQPEPSR